VTVAAAGGGRASSSKMPARSKPRKRAKADARPKPVAAVDLPISQDEQITYSNLSLHQLFESQTRAMLDRTDLDEEQKQNILIAMSCPCCGAGGLSYTAKLKG
jgi:hypothetical protein